MEIRFIESSHEYWLGNRKLPSVSELCDVILGDAYSGIPDHILKQAGDFGTKVHSAIELWNTTGIEMNLTPYQQHCLNEWKKLSVDILVLENEVIGHYEGIFAGTFDMVGMENGKTFLYDYKTTADFHRERVRLQLSLYRLKYGWDKVDGIKAVWLPKKGYGQIIELECWNKDELLKAVERAMVIINGKN